MLEKAKNIKINKEDVVITVFGMMDSAWLRNVTKVVILKRVESNNREIF